MKARTLFIIILRVYGIYLIKDLLVAVPRVVSDYASLFTISIEYAIVNLFVSLLLFGLHLLIVYYLLVRTSYLVSKLRLTEDLEEEPLRNDLNPTTVYTIAVITAGLTILAFAIPGLVRHFYSWYTYIDSGRQAGMEGTFAYGSLLTAIAEVMVGLLFLGNQRTIVSFVARQARKRD